MRWHPPEPAATRPGQPPPAAPDSLTGGRGGGRHRRPRRRLPWWSRVPIWLLAVLAVAVLVRTVAVQLLLVPSDSMADTVRQGDRILIDKLVYDLRAPRRGEVVAFRGTGRWASPDTAPAAVGAPARFGRVLDDLVAAEPVDHLARVVGLPGDRVGCCDRLGRLTVNGHPVDESYLNGGSGTGPDAGGCTARRFADVVVPPGTLWVLGDHRARSADARCRGPIRVGDVVGRAVAVVLPVDRRALLSVPRPWRELPD